MFGFPPFDTIPPPPIIVESAMGSKPLPHICFAHALFRPFHQTDSPEKAKHFTVNGPLANIVTKLAPIWADPSVASTADGRKVVSFLLNLASCVRVLPPTGTPVLRNLDPRLLPVVGALCAADANLRGMYPAVADASVRTLKQKTIQGVFHSADEVLVGVGAIAWARMPSALCCLPVTASCLVQ